MTTPKSEPPGIGDWVYVSTPGRGGPTDKPALVKGATDGGRRTIVEYLVGGFADVVATSSCRVYRRFGESRRGKETIVTYPLPGEAANPIQVMQTHYRRCGHAVLSPMVSTGKAYKITAFLDVQDWCPTCKPELARKPRTP